MIPKKSHCKLFSSQFKEDLENLNDFKDGKRPKLKSSVLPRISIGLQIQNENLELISMQKKKPRLELPSTSANKQEPTSDHSISEDLTIIKAQLEAAIKENAELRKENEELKENQKLAKKLVEDYENKIKVLESKLDEALRNKEEPESHKLVENI